MKSLTSINQNIPPLEVNCLDAYPLEGFFVIVYQNEHHGLIKVFYNQNGREVFRLQELPQVQRAPWLRFTGWLRLKNHG